jgi:NTE family protein
MTENTTLYKNKSILVLSGGGIKGITHLGALKKLEEKNILSKIETFAGTSVGAMICLLLIVGYSVDEMFDFVKDFDFVKMFTKKMKLDKMFDKYGIDSGNRFIIIVEDLLKEKNIDTNITFQELFEKTKKNFYVNATCVNDKKSIIFSHTSNSNMSVVKAIRMSASLPLYFIPVEHDGKLYIDGGCMNNILLEPFMNELDKVIGIYVESNYYADNTISDFLSYIMGTIQCLINGIITTSISCLKDIIRIKLNDINILSFNLSIDEKIKLFNAGYNSI